MIAEAWDWDWDDWTPDGMEEIPPRPIPRDRTVWTDERGQLRAAGPAALALAAVAVAGLAGVAVYAWRRDWPRFTVCTVLSAGCGAAAWALAR